MYTLDKCSYYTIKKINGINAYIFNDHNMAFPVWGEYSTKLGKPLSLITFDFHADTRFAIKKAKETLNIEKLTAILNEKNSSYSFEKIYTLSSSYIKNDEHIILACDFGYLNNYTVICDEKTYNESLDLQAPDVDNDYNAKYYSRLQWNTNYENICRALKKPLILDIDLDFFRSNLDMDETFKKSIKSLLNDVEVITIAKEPNFFKSSDSSFTNEYALETLLQIIGDY